MDDDKFELKKGGLFEVKMKINECIRQWTFLITRLAVILENVLIFLILEHFYHFRNTRNVF